MAKKNNFLINISIMLGMVVLTLLFCNWAFNKFVGSAEKRTVLEKLAANNTFNDYSKPELDLSLPLYTNKQGAACINAIRTPTSMQYSPYFGWNAHKLDKTCAKQHFAQKGLKILYFGGSSMQNFEAPNYLTKIDNFVSDKISEAISINLAESGGRSTNNLVRLMVEAIDLPVDYWVFLDGYNEFNSIKYNGSYDEDFYWTASVKDRIHSPVKFLMDKLISKSKLGERVFYGSGLLKNPRVRTSPVSTEEIYAAADFYVENFHKISFLCEAKRVKCLFFLQPYKRDGYVESNRILDIGYARILQQLGDKVIDLRPLFTDNQDAFLDDVHYNRKGSRLVADAIVQQIYGK